MPAEELLAAVAVAVVVFGELAAHIQPVVAPQTTREDDVWHAHVIQLDADDAGYGGKFIYLCQQVGARFLAVGAKELIIFHKGAVLRCMAGFADAVDGVPMRVL